MAMKLGSAKMANLVAIGAMIAKVPVVSFDSMAQVIRKKFKPELAVLNIKAMQYGFDAVTAGKGE
jgi:Pyruvate/2-oxoacid:ferredoxin oxidoreductase gamma subunit